MGFVILLLISLWAIKNFQKATIFTAIVIQAMPHLGTGISGVRIFPASVVVLSLLWFTKERFNPIYKNVDFKYPPLITFACLFISICYLITDYVTERSNLPLIIINLLTYFIFPYLVYKCFSNRKSLNFYFKVSIIFFLIATFYSFVEQIFKYNFFYHLMEQIFPFDMWSSDSSEIRYGLKRCNSIFAQGGHMAIHCSYAFLLFFYLKYYFKINHKSIKLSLLLYTLIITILFSGSRALFVGAGIIFLCLPYQSFFKRKSSYIIIFLLSIALIISIPLLSEIIDSILYSNKGQGSSTEMREWQWAICMKYFVQSPWWGNGRMYIWDVVSKENPLLLGAESIWFSLVVEYGIMGCFSYLVFIIFFSITLARIKLQLLFFPISYLAITSFSTALGMEFNVPLTYGLILIAMFKHLKKTIKYENINNSTNL